MTYDQYKVVLVNLDPTIGSEIRKTRPCIVISPIEMNNHLRTLIVAPLTSQPRKYPTRVAISYQGKMSMCALDQIRTIDKKRIVKFDISIKSKEMLAIKEVIREMLVD